MLQTEFLEFVAVVILFLDASYVKNATLKISSCSLSNILTKCNLHLTCNNKSYKASAIKIITATMMHQRLKNAKSRKRQLKDIARACRFNNFYPHKQRSLM